MKYNLPPIPIPKASQPKIFLEKKKKGLAFLPPSEDFDPITDFPYSLDKERSKRGLDRMMEIYDKMKDRQKKYGLPDFVIAGGAIRDIVFGLRQNDIDVFVPQADDDEAYLWTGSDVFHRIDRPEYGLPDRQGNGGFIVLQEGGATIEEIMGNRAPYQIISRGDYTTPVDLVETFDYNIVKAAFSEGEFIFHPEFIDGVVNSVVTNILSARANNTLYLLNQLSGKKFKGLR